jgi:hypothetical protein
MDYKIVKGILLQIEERHKAGPGAELFYRYHINEGKDKPAQVSRFKDMGVPSDEERTWEKEQEVVEIKAVVSGIFLNFFDKDSIRKVDMLEDMQKTLETEKEVEIVQPLKQEVSADKGIVLAAPSDQVKITKRQGGFLSPACSIDEAVAAFKLFEDAKGKILSSGGKDYIVIGKDGKPCDNLKDGKVYICRSGWRKLARFFGLSWTIINLRKQELKQGDYLWIATAQVRNCQGDSVTQEGVASSRDSFFTKGSRVEASEEDVIMKAETVALNRAISDLLGSGDVSADELKERETQ